MEKGRDRLRQRRGKDRDRGKQRMSRRKREEDGYKIVSAVALIYRPVFTDTSQGCQSREVTAAELGGRERGSWERSGARLIGERAKERLRQNKSTQKMQD